jgi:sulfide dehydrogenase cytochrome subunit
MTTAIGMAVATLTLAAPASAAPINIEGLARTCNGCHGTGGVSVGQSMPSIAGLPEAYLNKMMLEWKRGERASASMTRLIKGYSDEEIAALSKYFAKLPWTPVVQKASAEVIAQARDATGRCETCHGVTGGEPDDEQTPRLNGQWAKYMELEMLKYLDPAFKMTHSKMINNVRRMGGDAAAAAAQYYGSQKK